MNKVLKNKVDTKEMDFPKKYKYCPRLLSNEIFKYSHKTIFIIKLLNKIYYLGHVCLEPILDINILFKYINILIYLGMTRSVKIQVLQSLISARLILDESVRPSSDTQTTS